MPERREFISLEDVTFDESGRAVITKPETVARLKGVAGEMEAIKNIGCCSVALESGQIRAEDLARLTADSIRAIGPDQLSKLSTNAIKNIGCCSVA